MKTIDFYQGYEGEPEFILTRRARSGIDSCILRLWDGYFHDTIEQIPPGTDGNWQGVTLHYHVRLQTRPPYRDHQSRLGLPSGRTCDS